MKPSSVHIWAPELRESMGGIQMFSRFLFQALCDCLPDTQISVFSKNDRSTALPHEQPTRVFCTGRWPKSVRSFVFASRILMNARRDRPELIITTHLNFGPIARMLQRSQGIPYWCVAHGIEAWGLEHRGRIRALREANRILSVSQFTRECLLRELALDPKKVDIFPNTFEPQRFRVGPKPVGLLNRYRLRPDQKIILTVGRLVGRERSKGFDEILQALPRIRETLNDVHYLIAGTGPDRLRLEMMARRLGVADYVTFAGFVSHEELPDYYNLCDVFAMPSKGEGFGIVFLEAMACGKPVVAGNKDGSVDALCGGVLGALVDPDNVLELADTLVAILSKRHHLRIFDHPELLRQGVISRFGFDAFRSQLACLLERSDISTSIKS